MTEVKTKAALYPQATPVQMAPNVSLIPLVKMRDKHHPSLICELYSTYSSGWHWVSSVVADTAQLPSGRIVDVYHHEEPFSEQELEMYLSGFTEEALALSDNAVGSFEIVQDTTNDPYQLIFQLSRLLENL